MKNKNQMHTILNGKSFFLLNEKITKDKIPIVYLEV
jgi:hypothetical protein